MHRNLHNSEMLIASVARPDVVYDRIAEREAIAMLIADGCGVEVGRGCWEGVEEPCLVVQVPDVDRREQAVELFKRRFKQTAVLHLTRERIAILEYRDGTLEPLGRWREVDEETARKGKGWTELRGRYYVAGRPGRSAEEG